MKKTPVLLGTLLLAFFATEVSAGSKRVEHPFRAEISAMGIRRIEVDVPPSEIEIRNGSEESIVIEGVVKKEFGREADRAEVQQIVDAISMKIETTAARATITPKYEPKAQSRWARRDSNFKITISVPKGTHVEVRQSAGEVDIDGEFGDIDVAMRVGEIRISVPKSSVRELFAKTKIGEVETDLGDRVLSNEGIFPRSSHYVNEQGAHEVRASLHIGEITIRLH